MRTPIVRIPSTGAVAGIQHWHRVAMISHKENQASSSSNHMQRVEARATVLGKLQTQARLSLSISASRIVQHHSHHCCVPSLIILWPGGSSVANSADVFADKQMSHVQ